MLTNQLKINVNNIKKEVNNHYFKYRDIFYRILITNICIHNLSTNTMLSNTIIEDSSYNQYFLFLANRQLGLKELLSELNISDALNLYMDLSLYIDEFIQVKHDNKFINVYSILITDDGNLIVSNKKLSKRNIEDVQS